MKLRVFSVVLLILSLLSCKHSSDKLVIGTIAGPETDLVRVAQEVAMQQYGLPVKIIEFNDYNLPNEALADGSLDVNIYQHLPYLNAAMKAHGYPLEIVGKSFIYPMGIYSKKLGSLAELPQHATIAIPNDPSNESRALLLLEKAGLIELKKATIYSLNDIQANSKNLVFKELDAAQLARVLPDVDAAVINSTFAIPAGLHPSQDAIYLETKDSPYANLIVIRQDSAKKEQINQFIKAFQSTAVKNKAQVLFGDAAIPAW